MRVWAQRGVVRREGLFAAIRQRGFSRTALAVETGRWGTEGSNPASSGRESILTSQTRGCRQRAARFLELARLAGRGGAREASGVSIG